MVYNAAIVLLLICSQPWVTFGSFQPFLVVFPSGIALLHWQADFPIADVHRFNISIEFGPSDSVAFNSIPRHLICSHPALMRLSGYCVQVETFSMVFEISLLFKNGTESAVERTIFKEWHNNTIEKSHNHSHGSGANKTIEEMFHTLQSEVGQLRQHIEQLDANEHSEEHFTRVANGIMSIVEVFLIWASPLFAAIGAVLAAKFGLKKRKEQAINGDPTVAQQEEGDIIRLGEDEENANLI